MAAHEGMQTGTVAKLWGLDHLRALAIMLVFLFHYGRLFPHPDWVEAISKFGWTGVDLFFVLSGYLIASQLFKQIKRAHTISFRRFFQKRFFRIIPAYAVVVTIYFLFPYVHEREALAPLWKFVTFTQNLGLDLRTQGTFSHAWSLCIEEQFYLFLPLILAALLHLKAFSKGGWILPALFIAGFVIRYYSYQHWIAPQIDQPGTGIRWYRYLYYPTYCRLDGLLTGVGLAALFTFKPYRKQEVIRWKNWLFLFGLIVLTAAYFICLDEESFDASVFGFPLISMGYGLLVAGAVSPGSMLYRFPSRITTFIATLSYAIYLTHKMVIHIMQDLLQRVGVSTDSNLMFLACIITVILAGFILHLIIEKPFMRLRDNPHSLKGSLARIFATK